MPKAGIGKFTRHRFDQKAKDLAKSIELGDQKRYLSLDAYTGEYAEIMKNVCKPTITSTHQAGRRIPQLHYTSAGSLMIGASAEIELIKQQQAEEFVKRMHEDKANFEKKIREIEAEIERREKLEIETLKEYEQKKRVK